MILRLIAINSLVWLVLQLFVAAIFVRLPDRFFVPSSSQSRNHPAENYLYLKLLLIRQWKHLLPNGAAWVGRPARTKRPAAHNPDSLRPILIEANRSEAAHWLMMAACPIFFCWNPPVAWPILIVYALVANLPCIAAQRYNRRVVERILRRIP